MTFKTKKEAVDFLNLFVEDGLLNRAGTVWFEPGYYVLNHGEYDRPDLKPVRYKDGWKIKVTHYYYTGTFNTPVDGPVELATLDGHLEVTTC